MFEESLGNNLNIGQYWARMQGAANIGTRRKTARGLYLTVISALLAFAALYGAKLNQFQKMEEELPFKYFTDEYQTLKKDWRYTRLTTVECFVATTFVTLFIAALALNCCAHT